MSGLVELKVFELAPIRHKALRLCGLPPERNDVALDLGDDVTDAQKILLRELHLFLSLFLATLELRDSGGFLDEKTPILRFRADDEADFALLDDRVGLGPGARSEKQIGHIAKTHRCLVDEVFALAGPKEAASDRNFCVCPELKRHFVRDVVVERERHFCEVVWSPRFAAVEDDILHGTTPKVPSTLLTHAPSNRIHDVRLPTPVGTDDGQDIVVETQNGSVHERLEANELELLYLHPFSGRSPTMDRRDVTSHIVKDRAQMYRQPRVQGKGKWGLGIEVAGADETPAPFGALLDRVPRQPYSKIMPTYEYSCAACGHAWELVQRISEPPAVLCPKCMKSEARRLISGGTNFILKGGGWYSDLYSSPKALGKESTKTNASETSSSSTPASPAASTTETKAPSPATATPASPT